MFRMAPIGQALAAIAPSFLTYVLSFVYVAIYWNNHHHLLHTVVRVDGMILWANSYLLFWLSVIPAATAWMGQNLLAPVPTAVYGGALLMPAIAYYSVAKGDHSPAGRTLGAGQGAWQRLQGQDFADTLYRRHRAGLCQSVGVDGGFMCLSRFMWLVPDQRIANVIGRD